MYYFYTDFMPNGKKFEFTFLSDFDIADYFGIKAVKDTYEKCLKNWSYDIKAIAEMTVALNMRCWFWFQRNNELCELYRELFYKLEAWVYRDGTQYSKDELSFYRDFID